MKRKLSSILLLMVLMSCAISIKENSDVRKFNFKGRVQSIEEFTANPEKSALKNDIQLEDLSFATTLFQHFDKRGNLLEERIFSNYGVLQRYDKYVFDNSGKKIAMERYGSEKEFIYSRKYEYDEQGRISKERTYDNEEKLIEEAIWNYENGTKGTVFDENGEKLTETISEFGAGNVLTRKVIFDYEFSSPYQTEISYNEQGKKVQETHLDKEEKFLGKIVWKYEDNWLQKDEFNQIGFTLRKEKEFDDNGNLIMEKLYIPTFQPEIQEVDWENDYSSLEEFRFHPEQYNLYMAEEKAIFYEFDEVGNWVLRKLYVNKQLAEIQERMISYY